MSGITAAESRSVQVSDSEIENTDRIISQSRKNYKINNIELLSGRLDTVVDDEGEDSQNSVPFLKNIVERKKEDILQIWDGMILEKLGEEVLVGIKDKTNPENPDEEIKLDISEFDPNDYHLIEEGALFFWHIGYRSGYKYPRESFSKVKVRRLPKWSAAEIKRADSKADTFIKYFDD